MRLGKSQLIGISAVAAMPLFASAAAFSDRSVIVVRSGDANIASRGDLSVGGAAVPAYLDEYSLHDGTLIQSIPLGNSADPSSAQFALLGQGTNSGLIAKSYDGQSLVLGGYFSALTNAAPVADTTVKRTVARIGMNGSVDTTTQFSGTSTYQVRSVASDDGNHFWVSTDSSSNRVKWVNGIGATTSTTASNFGNSIALNIFKDLTGSPQLYATRNSNSNAFYTLTHSTDAYNTKLPTGTPSGNATVTSRISTASGTSAWDFVIFNDNTTLTLYFTDEDVNLSPATDPNSGAGVQKWTSTDGTTWTQAPYMLTGPAMRGLTGGIDPVTGMPVLFATATNGTGLYQLHDGGPGSAWNLFVAAPDNMYFHDVVAPFTVPEPASLGSLGVAGLLLVRRRKGCSRH